jgi:hypothetical protein
MKPAVAFIVFNRPVHTRRVFAAIRAARPERLYLIADAPREGRAGEAERCAETRQVVEQGVDWPCRLEVNLSARNLGCGGRVASGLDWVFAQEEEAIVLEDDILPHPDFFPYCAALLERFRGHDRIMQITGYNRFHHDPGGSYFFSRYCDIWGWASWARHWRRFAEADADAWARAKAENSFAPRCRTPREAELRGFVLDQIFSGRLNAWGMRWELAKILHGGLGVVPSRNLVRNIGFGPGASHTVNPFTRDRFMRLHPLPPPYQGPAEIASDPVFDRFFHDQVLHGRRWEKWRSALVRWLFRREV